MENVEDKSIEETKSIENWRITPTPIVLKNEMVIIELIDEFETIFIEGQENFILDECRADKYYLKTKQGVIPETLIMIRIIGKNILMQLEKGSVPFDASIWVIMNDSSCHLILKNTGPNYRKYVLMK